MRNLTIDDDTYAAWQQRAAARGLSVEEWLKRKTGQDNGNGQTGEQPVKELTPSEQLNRLEEFYATLVGRGGTAEFDRENIYGQSRA